MPEVIEVKKYSDYLRKKVRGVELKDVKILNGRYKKKPFESYQKLRKILPLKVLNVESKGKLTYFTFDNNIWMLCTLGLSGGWFYKKDNKMYHPLSERYMLNKDKTDNYLKNAMNHLNVEFNFGDTYVYFYDMLSFGTIKIIDNINELNKKLSSLGPDMMDQHMKFDTFREKIKQKSNMEKYIGNVLMNQKIISGIGNYLRADTLWMSKISPFRKVKNLTDNELKKIYDSVRFLIWSEYNYNRGVKLGIIDKNTKTPSDYKKDFFVYNQDKDIYGNAVTKEELFEGSQKRFMYWVPKIQK